MQAAVTIGIPIYNCERTIRQAVQSVFAQSYQNWRLILINDGSTDRSYELIKDIKDDRVTVISGPNKGLIYRLNEMVSLTNTRYFVRMDGDDIMHPHRLSEQIGFMEANPEVDVTGGTVYTIDENDNPVGKRGSWKVNDPVTVIKRGVLIHPTVAGKTEWFRTFRYDSNYYRAEDRELWCRSFGRSFFAVIDKPLLFYREGRVSIRNYSASQVTVRKIYRVYGNRMMGSKAKRMAILSSYCKQYIYEACGLLRLQHRLTAARNEGLSDQERLAARKVLDSIKRVQVAGLGIPAPEMEMVK